MLLVWVTKKMWLLNKGYSHREYELNKHMYLLNGSGEEFNNSMVANEGMKRDACNYG